MFWMTLVGKRKEGGKGGLDHFCGSSRGQGGQGKAPFYVLTRYPSAIFLHASAQLATESTGSRQTDYSIVKLMDRDEYVQLEEAFPFTSDGACG